MLVPLAVDVDRQVGVHSPHLSDVFGPQRILWVEGPTESICFPLIASAFDIDMIGAAILPVVNTGDFNHRQIKSTVDIYDSQTA